ncbi:MAG: hypothetical protein NVSMB12_05340 [Acidimicrobiales bacterium]
MSAPSPPRRQLGPERIGRDPLEPPGEPVPSRGAPGAQAPAPQSGPKHRAKGPTKGRAAGTGRTTGTSRGHARGRRPEALSRHERREARIAAGGGRRGLLWRGRKILFALVFLLFTALAGSAYALSRLSLPPPTVQAQTTFVVDANDKPLAQLSGGQNRQPVAIDQVPPVMVDAVIATEDRGFYKHHGIDPLGIVRALANDLRGRGNLQGASTLTQQYVKNAYLGQQRTLTRKLREAVLALKVERQLTKRQILERYLNTIYFGRGAYGVEAAAQAYFHVDVGKLDLAQAAYLAGVIRAPELADPTRSPQTARLRRNRTLLAMVKTRAASMAQVEPLLPQPVSAEPYKPADQKLSPEAAAARAEYYVAAVTRELIQKYNENVVYGGGLRVKTSLDITMQKEAYDSVYSQVLTDASGPAGALVSVDSGGAVKAMVGGRDYNASKVNLALGPGGGGTGRQPGSTMKAILLAEIVHEKYSVLSSFPAPAQILLPKANNGQDWKVNNFNNEDFGGSLNLIDATKDSVNTVYAQAVRSIGPEAMSAMALKMGLGALPPYASLVLGTVDESVINMAGAYSVFADKGTYVAPHLLLEVKNSAGKDLLGPRDGPRLVLTKAESDVVTHCLRQVVLNGTGTGAAFSHDVAGKTGTTESNTDAWFVGFTPQLSTAVWMGYPSKSQPMTNLYGVHGGITGGTLPADIFRRYMSAALSGAPFAKFDEPNSFPGNTLGPPAGAQYITPTTYASPTSVVSGATTSITPGATTTTVPKGGTTTTVKPRSSSTTTPSPTTSPPTTVAAAATGPSG